MCACVFVSRYVHVCVCVCGVTGGGQKEGIRFPGAGVTVVSHPVGVLGCRLIFWKSIKRM